MWKLHCVILLFVVVTFFVYYKPRTQDYILFDLRYIKVLKQSYYDIVVSETKKRTTCTKQPQPEAPTNNL